MLDSSFDRSEMSRATRFVDVFSGVAVVLCALTAAILVVVLVILLNEPADKLRVVEAGQSGLSQWLLSHVVVFNTVFLIFSTTAVFAALGLRQRRKWAYVTWIVLLILMIICSILYVISEIASLTRGFELASAGVFPSFSALSAIMVGLVGLGLIAFCLFLLRRLLSRSTRSLFDAPTPSAG